MKTAWMLAMTGAFLSTAALAQTQTQTQTPTTAQAPAAASAQPPQSPSSSVMQAHMNLQQQMKSDLEKSGFTDVAVRPDSFLVRAKDKSGNPVTMIIDPDSLTELVEPNVSNATGSTAIDQGASSFTTVPGSEALGSKIIGTEVYNSKNQDIGTIKDIAYAGQRVQAYIVGVGGFLGVGDHDVAVTPTALHVSFDSNAKTWRATMNTTTEQLKAAPEFKYAS